jgi:hypothetical protein
VEARVKRKGRIARAVARVKAALSDVSDGAVEALANVNRAPAAEVDSERARWSPLAFVHHQRALMNGDKRAKRHRGEWVYRLRKMEREDPDGYASYMLEVDTHIDAGELVVILPPELADEAHERARVSGPAITKAMIEAPYHGATPQELAAARVDPDTQLDSQQESTEL